MSTCVGSTLEAFVDDTIFAAGYCDAKSCTTTMWFELGMSPHKLTATFGQHFSGMLCSFCDSCVLLFVKIWQSLQCLTNCFTFLFKSKKKKCTVISGKICVKCINSFFAVLGIQVCPLVTISQSCFKFLSLFVALAIAAIPVWSMIGVVCRI